MIQLVAFSSCFACAAASTQKVRTADGPAVREHAGAQAAREATPPPAPIEPGSEPTARTDAETQPWLGVELRQGKSGVQVVRVFRGSPAAAAGIQPGDGLLTLGGVGLSSVEQVHATIAGQRVGRRTSVSVRRDGEQRMLSLVLAATPSPEEQMRLAYVNSPAPSISQLLTVQGSVVPSWASLAGKVVILEFWAGWCVACRALTPTFNRYHETLTARGVRVLGVTSDPFEEAERSSRALGLRYPVFSDEDGSVTQAYRALALPSVFVVDKHGVVRDLMVGLQPDRLIELEQLAKRLADE